LKGAHALAPWFIASEKFDKAHDGWAKFIEWSRLEQPDEVVSVDPALCPTLLPEIKADYWPRIVNDDFMLDFFTDANYLRSLVAEIQRKNFLCVVRNPSTRPVAAVPEGFDFLGYDLADIQGSTSALTNCGGFPHVFSNSELSAKGLLSSFVRAKQVQDDLRRLYPEEIHADCHLWAIFRGE
jgi:hypothetical protein